MARNTKVIVKFRSIDNSYLIVLEKIEELYRRIKQSDKYSRVIDSMKSEFDIKKAFSSAQEMLNELLNSQDIIKLSEYQERSNENKNRTNLTQQALQVTQKPNSQLTSDNKHNQKCQFTKSSSIRITVIKGISVTFIIQTSTYIVSGCSNGFIYAHEINYDNNKVIKCATVTKHEIKHAITSMCSVNRDSFFVGYSNGTIILWRIRETLILIERNIIIQPHSSAITHLNFDGANCISCSKDTIQVKPMLLSNRNSNPITLSNLGSVSSVLKLKKGNCIVFSDTNKKRLCLVDLSAPSTKTITLTNIYTESSHGIVELNDNTIAVAAANEPIALAVIDTEKGVVKHTVNSLIKGNPRVCLYFIDNFTLCYFVGNYLYVISTETYTILTKCESQTLNSNSNMLFDKGNYIVVEDSSELSFFKLTKNTKMNRGIGLEQRQKITYHKDKTPITPTEKPSGYKPKLSYKIDKLQKIKIESSDIELPNHTCKVTAVLVILSQNLILIGTSKGQKGSLDAAVVCALYEIVITENPKNFNFIKLDLKKLQSNNWQRDCIHNIVQLDEQTVIASTELFRIYIWNLVDKKLTDYLEFNTDDYIYNTILLTSTRIASLHSTTISDIDIYAKKIKSVTVTAGSSSFSCETFIKVKNYSDNDNNKYKVIVSIKYGTVDNGELQVYDENFVKVKTISDCFTFPGCIHCLYEIPDKPYIVTAYRKDTGFTVDEQKLVLINLTNFTTESFDIKDRINITNNCSFTYHDGTVFFVSENTVIQFKDHLDSTDVKSLSVAYTKRDDKYVFDLEGVCFNILPDGNHALSISHERTGNVHNYSLIVFKIEKA